MMSDDFDDDNEAEELFLDSANDNANDDMMLPFALEKAGLRGRIVRLGVVLDDILEPHNYPPVVAQLVAESVTLTLLLGGMLKYDGVFTLQAQGDGPVRLVVADLTTSGEVRGTAAWDAEKLAAIGGDGQVVGLHATDRTHDLGMLMGKGHLAFTVDQGEHTERYQGIVDLRGQTLADSVARYFAQSEQIGTIIRIAVAQDVDGFWRAGGLMLQRLPTHEGADRTAADEDWNRAGILMGTCKDDELLQETIESTGLLYRLFHEEGVRVFNPLALTKGCRCSMEKLQGILKTMTESDKAEMTVDGKITMTCEFCNRDFVFDPAGTPT